MKFIEAIEILNKFRDISIQNDRLYEDDKGLILICERDNNFKERYILREWDFNNCEVIDFDLTCDDILDNSWEVVEE